MIEVWKKYGCLTVLDDGDGGERPKSIYLILKN
jgi:hypothetical protein